MAPSMAVKVQNGQQDNFSLGAAKPVRRMNRDFQIRFTAILLALLTTAAVVYAGYNLSAERQFQIPDDGVWWFEEKFIHVDQVGNVADHLTVALDEGPIVFDDLPARQ